MNANQLAWPPQTECSRSSDPPHARSAFQLAPVSILVTDLTRYPAIVAQANRHTETLYGWPSAAIPGTPIIRFFTEQSWANIQMLIHRLGPSETICLDTTQVHRNGTLFPARVNASLHPSNTDFAIVVVDDLRLRSPQRHPVQAFSPGHLTEALTPAEMDVLRLVAQGVDNKDIASALDASVYTVANRLRIIYQKLAVTNRTQAALYALRCGWATLGDSPQ